MNCTAVSLSIAFFASLSFARESEPGTHLELELIQGFVQDQPSLDVGELGARVASNAGGWLVLPAQNNAAGGSQVLVKDPVNGLWTPVSFGQGDPNREFVAAAITNELDPRILSIDVDTTQGVNWSLRSWRFSNPGSATLIGSTFNQDFDELEPFVAVNDAGWMAFPATINGAQQCALMASFGQGLYILDAYPLGTQLRPSMSETDELVVRDDQQQIVLFDLSSNSTVISTGFQSVGAFPSISKDGRTVVFSGDRGQGLGVFASIEVAGSREILLLAGEGNDELTDIDLHQRVDVLTDGDLPQGMELSVAFAGDRAGQRGVFLMHGSIIDQFGLVANLEPLHTVACDGNELSDSFLDGFILDEAIIEHGQLTFRARIDGHVPAVIRAARCGFTGRVVMGRNKIPMNHVVVRAIDATSRAVLDEDETNEFGDYCLRPGVSGEYIIQASLVWTGDWNGASFQIANYPASDPLRTYTYVADEGIRIENDIYYPEPVILQGGLYGSTGTWSDMAPYLREDPANHPDKAASKIPAFLVLRVPNDGQDPGLGYHNEGGETGQHDRNGRLLRDRVNALSIAEWISNDDLFPAGSSGVLAPSQQLVKYSLIAHSMGGLIARAMLTANPDIPVQRIICLDSTHGGTTYGIVHPALNETMLNGLSLFPFTEPVGELRGWNNSHIVGPGSTRDWLLYACNEDHLVSPHNSAHGVGRSWTGFPFYAPSGWEGQWIQAASRSWLEVSDSHGASHDNPDRLRECALWMLDDTPPPGAGPPTSMPVSVGASPEPPQLTLTAHAGANSITQVPYHMDAGGDLHVEMLLRGADGNADFFHPSVGSLIASNLVIDEISENVWSLSFDILSHPSGLTIFEIEGYSDSAEATLLLRFAGTERAVLEVSPRVQALGQPVQLTTWIEDDQQDIIVGNNGGALVRVRKPGGNESLHTMFDDGQHGDGAANDGVFGVSITAGEEGRTILDSLIQTSAGNQVFERSAVDSWAVLPGGASLTSGITAALLDEDQDQIAEGIEFEVIVDFARNGNFRLTGDLCDANGQLVNPLTLSVQNNAGPTSQSAILFAPGPLIRRAGGDGPWTLRDVRLLDEDADSLLADTTADFVTPAWALLQFEPPLLPVPAGGSGLSGSMRGGNVFMLLGANLGDTTNVRVGVQASDYEVTGHESLRVTVPAFQPWPYLRIGQPFPDEVLADITIETPWGSVVLNDAYRYER